MLKKHLCLTFCLVLLLTFIYVIETSACPPECIQKTKYEYTICKLKTPRRLVWYNFYHFGYLSDIKQFGIKDYWQSPIQFFINRKGDCEDYAVWNYTVLKHHGYKVQIVIVKNHDTDRNHALIKVIIKGKIKYVDMNDYYKRLPDNYEVFRILNEPYEDRIMPYSKEKKRDSITLKEGEMIKIK